MANSNIKKNNLPKNVGIIMDGNGRWAIENTLKIAEGHNYVIMGHYHHSYHKILDGGELILLGECNENDYNYAIFDGNKLEIKNF